MKMDSVIHPVQLYKHSTVLQCPMKEALQSICDLLQKKGFNIEAVIDLKKRYRCIGMSIPARVILSISHNSHAPIVEGPKQTFPCTIVLSEENGGTAVSSMIPQDLVTLARQVCDTECAISGFFQDLQNIEQVVTTRS